MQKRLSFDMQIDKLSKGLDLRENTVKLPGGHLARGTVAGGAKAAGAVAAVGDFDIHFSKFFEIHNG